MHLSGEIAGDSSVSGILTGCFSGSQIVIGILLGAFTKVTKKYTLSAAMASFSIGALILILFPDNALLLAAGAVFCGFSQGIFIHTASTYIANVVPSVATAFAAATFTVAMNVGQLISPTVLNGISKAVFGETTTTGVYILAAAGMLLAAAAMAWWQKAQAE